jgi:ubiquinone/menaquinone biosynthesis C-methylase UbiE
VNLPAIIGVVIGAIVVIGLTWRYAYFCPSWLVPLLENPYVEAVAGGGLLVQRAGVRAGMQVLDAGCGPGRITLPAAEAVGASGRVVALDIQPRMLEKLERRLHDRGGTSVVTVLAGLGDGKLPANTFDVAFLVTVLGEVPDKNEALREIHRSLRPGGILSITEVLPDPHYQPIARVRQLATRAGFREQRLFPGVLSYTMNVVKDESDR